MHTDPIISSNIQDEKKLFCMNLWIGGGIVVIYQLKLLIQEPSFGKTITSVKKEDKVTSFINSKVVNNQSSSPVSKQILNS